MGGEGDFDRSIFPDVGCTSKLVCLHPALWHILLSNPLALQSPSVHLRKTFPLHPVRGSALKIEDK